MFFLSAIYFLIIQYSLIFVFLLSNSSQILLTSLYNQLYIISLSLSNTKQTNKKAYNQNK